MGTNFQAGQYDHCQHISIHVPHEGHDKYARRKPLYQAYFNPRAPRGARRQAAIKCRLHTRYFNPRAPRGARHAILAEIIAPPMKFQSTCPARGTTQRVNCDYITTLFQSTCPARGTTCNNASICNSSGFQSTCPARGTTDWLLRKAGDIDISIHVPREGHDCH